jgi:hypothetical protein
MAYTDSHPDLKAHDHVVHLSDPEVVSELSELLGPRAVAYLGNVKETRAVRQWADGSRAPSAAVMQRLRHALQLACMLSSTTHVSVVQSWFQGMNPKLDDVSPLRMLREDDLQEVAGPRTLAAARTFLISG